MIKKLIHQGDITSLNIYPPNIREPKCIKLTPIELKVEINNNTVIGGNLILDPQQWLDHPDRGSIRKQQI